jgi:hypothetical protein
VDGADDGRPSVTRNALQLRHDAQRSEAVKAAGGLVNEQHSRRSQDACCNGQAPALATRQAAQHQPAWQAAANLHSTTDTLV